MANYLLKNIAWVIDEEKPAVTPVAFNANKSKIRDIQTGKVHNTPSFNPYKDAGQAFGLNYCARSSFQFFDNNRDLLPLNIRMYLSKKGPYLFHSTAQSEDRGLIENYLECTIMSEKDIVKIAKRFELKLVKKEIDKLRKKCNNLKKSIKGKKEPVTTEDLVKSIDF